MTNSISEIPEAGCLLVIGSNTTEAHPVIGLQVRKAVRKNGAKLIVANPREIDLCRIADTWLRLRPGTDVALLNGLAHVIVRDGLQDAAFLENRTEGFEAWRGSIAQYTPELVSKITGVPVSQIEQAAWLYATGGQLSGPTRNSELRPQNSARPSSSILYTMGITQHTTGTDNVKAVANLSMLTGNVGKPSSGVNPLRGQSNVQGACDMGCLPDVYTGYQKVANEQARQKFESSWGCALPEEPGSTMPEMLKAIEAGQIRAMYIMGENPLVSDPDVNHLRHVLGMLDFLVVQDIFLTETANLADVVLPGASFAEKDGTFTNTERRIQRVRKAIEPVGEAKPDWQIIQEVARRTAIKIGGDTVNLQSGFCQEDPAGVMAEIASVTPSYHGVRYELLEDGGLQWPVPSLGHSGTPILHVGTFSRGKGLFSVVDYLPPAELPNDEYPLLLTTGRRLFHYHTGSMTRKVSGLTAFVDREYVDVNPADARDVGVGDGDVVCVASRRGEARAQVRLSETVPRGVVFMDFHFSESPTNALTNSAYDPVSKIAELKVCAVRILPVREFSPGTHSIALAVSS